MSTYHGWDWEETHQASTTPTTLKRTSSLDYQYGQPVSSSFTPINYHQAPVEFISPLRTLRSRGIDGDSLYDLAEGNVADTYIRNERMFTSTQANNGREVSLGGVWEYRDEEDLAYQKLGELKASAPKRRKPAPAKRSKSTKVPSKTLAEFWDGDDPGVSQQSKEEGSQLTTPPDSTKRPKKKAAPSAPNAKEKIAKAFRNPTITKSAVVRGKKTDHANAALKIGHSSGLNDPTPETALPGDLPRSQHVSNHQGWTTTEIAVKHSYNGIAKTTLDKLAAFRYKSSSTDRPPEAPSTGLPEKNDRVGLNFPPACLSPRSRGFTHHDEIFEGLQGSAMTDTSLTMQYNRPSQIGIGHITSEHEMLSTNDTFFKDAVWNVKSSTGGHVMSGSFEGARLSQSLIPSERTANASDHHHSDYDDPTSSEARALRGLMSEADLVQEQQSVPGIAPSLSNREGLKLESTINLEPMFELQTDVQLSRQDQSNELRGQVKDTSKSLLINNAACRKLMDIEVERSDVDEDEIVSENVFNDYDEFYEGLDDADLLALASDSVIPETQMIPNAPLSVVESSGVNVPNSEMKSLDGQGDLGLSQKSSPELLDSELDEYLLDQLDLEAILQFPEPTAVVVEKRQAPTSVQYSLGIGSASDGVYDPSLQFSPPKSRTSVSSEKLPDAWLTNITSINNSSKHRFDPASVPISGEEEEEDWTFIHSKDSHFDDNTEDSEVQRAESQRCPLYDKDSNGLFHKRDARTQATTTEVSTALILSMLDDGHEYKPLKPFARPDFPILAPDRCPVVGTSAQTFLRVCFRIGEMFKEGARCNALSQDAVIELFARVTFSSREPGTTKQHFQFADLWHDRPPFPNGLLTNYKTSGLAESESKVFVGAKEAMMARCLGRLKRDNKSEAGWLLHIITIRVTDWEEIRWTKRIVSADLVKSEFKGLPKL